jgi:hypothetical protein
MSWSLPTISSNADGRIGCRPRTRVISARSLLARTRRRSPLLWHEARAQALRTLDCEDDSRDAAGQKLPAVRQQDQLCGRRSARFHEIGETSKVVDDARKSGQRADECMPGRIQTRAVASGRSASSSSTTLSSSSSSSARCRSDDASGSSAAIKVIGSPFVSSLVVGGGWMDPVRSSAATPVEHAALRRIVFPLNERRRFRRGRLSARHALAECKARVWASGEPCGNGEGDERGCRRVSGRGRPPGACD